MSESEFTLITEGVYVVAYSSHHTWMYRGRQPKVTVLFEIIDHTVHFGLVLPRHYNAKCLIDGPQDRGRAIMAKNSDYTFEYGDLFNHVPNLDRVTFEELRGLQIEAEIETVTSRHGGKARPECMYESKIGRLIKIIG